MQPAFAAYPAAGQAHRHRSVGSHNGFKKHKSTGGMTVSRFPIPQPTMLPNTLHALHTGWTQPQAQPLPGQNPYFGHYPQQQYGVPAENYLSGFGFAGFPSQQAAASPAHYGYNMTQPVHFTQQYGSHTSHPPSTTPNHWAGAHKDSTARLQSTDEQMMLQHGTSTVLSQDQSQSYFEFSAGNGPVHDQELPEDADEYCEFTRPCSYAAKDSEPPKEFSVGLIVCKTARPANSALPATWLDANPDPSLPAVAPSFEPDKCPSKYHSEPLRKNTLQPVRASNAWNEVKDDLIFREFPPTTGDVVSISSLRADYAARPDRAWTAKQWQESNGNSPSHRAQHVDSIPSKKRIFSQTEHALPDDPSKRYREDNPSDSRTHKNRNVYPADRRQRDAQGGRFSRHGAIGDGRPSHSDKLNGSRSKIFSNGHLNPTRVRKEEPNPILASGTAVTSSDTAAPVDNVHADASPPPHDQAQPEAKAESQEEQTCQVLSTIQAQNTVHQQQPSTGTTAPHLETSPQGQTQSPDPQPIRESAWARRAREYQARAKRDFDQMEDAFNYDTAEAETGRHDKRQR